MLKTCDWRRLRLEDEIGVLTQHAPLEFAECSELVIGYVMLTGKGSSREQRFLVRWTGHDFGISIGFHFSIHFAQLTGAAANRVESFVPPYVENNLYDVLYHLQEFLFLKLKWSIWISIWILLRSVHLKELFDHFWLLAFDLLAFEIPQKLGEAQKTTPLVRDKSVHCSCSGFYSIRQTCEFWGDSEVQSCCKASGFRRIRMRKIG